MPPLTRVEAVTRAAALRPITTRIALDLTSAGALFDSRTTLEFEMHDATDTFLDVRAEHLRSATLNGETLDLAADYDPAAGRLSLHGLRPSNELIVDAAMRYSHDGEGLHRHVDPADGRTYLYAMSFLDAAPRWFACFDQPDLKAPVELTVRCPDEWTVAGNGPAVRGADGAWRMQSVGPLASYFTTLVAGPYHSVRAEHDGITLALHVRQSLAAQLDRDAAELFAHTALCLDEFHRLFGTRYPWGEYHQAFVPDFNAGAMENPGCITFRDGMIFRGEATDAERDGRANTIAHEMAHMWFGDLVTMRWWDDLWLNESFAEYLGTRVCDAIGRDQAWVQFGINRKSWGHRADRRPSTHPVAGNAAADAEAALNEFDGISYAKGAAALRQLATRLGDPVLLAGLNRHFAAHAFGNAGFLDLIEAWTTAGAEDLDRWAHEWLQTSGMDTLRAQSSGTGVQVLLNPPAASPADREHALAVGAFGPDGTELASVAVVLSGGVTDVPLDVGSLAPTLVVPDVADETWAKIALSDSAWAAMPSLLPTLTDARTRVVVWNALRLAVADAEVDPALALRIVTGAVAAESDEVLEQTVGWAVEVIGSCLPEAVRPDVLSRLAAALTSGLSARSPGGRLAAARAVIVCSADVAWLRSWLVGEAPSGVVVDAELRWLVLERLAVLGGLSFDELDAAAHEDRTSEGAVHAARCRAALPDAWAKATAWHTLMNDPDCSNYVLYALAEGFWQPSQHALTTPYVERYFDEIAGTAAFRSGFLVGRLAQRAFPWPAVSPDTLSLADGLLARSELPVGIRRSVLDAADDLRRAVAVRTRFG